MSFSTSRKTSIILFTTIYFTLISFTESRSNYDVKQSYSNLRKSHQVRTNDGEISSRNFLGFEARAKTLDHMSMVTQRGYEDSREIRTRTTNTRWSGRQLNLPNISLAASNLQKIRKSYSCKKPRPRLVKVKDHYHVYDKTYVPGCTLLYKCDDEAGCCENDSMQCAAKMQEAVTVFFYVLYHNETKYNTVEALVFTNDTECECREITPHPRTFEPPLVQTEALKVIEPSSNHTGKELSLTYFMPADADSFNIGTTSMAPVPENVTQQPVARGDIKGREELNIVFEERPSIDVSKKTECPHVKCPHPFHAHRIVETPYARCVCECSQDYDFKRCLAIKKGLHKLSQKERRCIQQGICLHPNCEYPGYYDTISGRCPKEDDSFHDKKIHSSHRQPRGILPRD